MSNCRNIILASTLNILLVPTFLKDLSYPEICSFIESCSKESRLFVQQVISFQRKMKLAKSYTADRKCYCSTLVEWSVEDSPLIIDQYSLANYYDFVACNNKDFAFILRKVMNSVLQKKICRQMIQDGKQCCCKKKKNKCGNYVKDCHKC